MRKSLFAAAVLAAIATSGAAAADTAQQLVQPELKQITAWRRDLHEHPELSNREVRTAKLIANELKKLGYDVRTGIAHNGVTGVLKGGKPGPRLAIRADIDALPVTEQVDLPFASKATGEYLGKKVGVMHACGHDAHTAMTLGLAEILAKMRTSLPGEVMLIFQPAEEGPPPGEEGGAPLMVREGVFKDFKPDAIFGMHVRSAWTVGTVALMPGGEEASSDTFRIVVHGKGAAMERRRGSASIRLRPPRTSSCRRRPSSAASSISIAVPRWSRSASSTVASASMSFPKTTELQGTVRAFDEDIRQHALTSLKRNRRKASPRRMAPPWRRKFRSAYPIRSTATIRH